MKNSTIKQIITLILFLFLGKIFAQTYTPSAAISYSGKSNITIDGLEITTGTSNGAAIYLTNCTNIKITNCRFILNSGIIGVQLQSCSNIEITGCYFEKFKSGIYAISCTGGLNIHCNQFKDIAGIKPRGQMVQFNTCSGAGNKVNYNTLDHTFGAGTPEDLINMYASTGTASDPIQIIGNQLRGGGPSTSGGGIMIGDNGGHDLRVEDNILVDVGQYGIGAPAGYNMTIINNKVFGASNTWTNVGIYVGLQGEIDAGFPCTGSTITVKNNQVKYYNKSGTANGWYNCSCCPVGVNSGNNWNASITSSILPATLTLNTTMCPVTNNTPTTVITSVSLIDATVGTAITDYTDLSKTSVINKSTLTTTQYNIYANITGTVDSLVFTYTINGTAGRKKEGASPYALRGDGTGYVTWDLPTGTYAITANAYVNGTAEATKTVNFTVTDVSTNINTNSSTETFLVYPNPASESLVVSTKSLVNSNTEIQITNTLGQIVFSSDYRLTTNYSINISQFPLGLYFIKVGNQTKKFIKQ